MKECWSNIRECWFGYEGMLVELLENAGSSLENAGSSTELSKNAG